MKKYLTALLVAGLVFATSFSVEAGRYGGGGGFRSGGFSSPSRSYSRPSTPSYSRPSSRPAPAVARPTSRPTPQANRPVVVNQHITQINRTRVVYRPRTVTRNYSSLPYYHPQPQPGFFQSNAGWLAFTALAGYMILSDDDKQTQPGPDTTALQQVPAHDMGKALWQDGTFDAKDVQMWNEWKRQQAVAEGAK